MQVDEKGRLGPANKFCLEEQVDFLVRTITEQLEECSDPVSITFWIHLPWLISGVEMFT